MILFLIGILLGSSEVWAEQNFFNVPSSEITEEKQIFFQEQINFSSDSVFTSDSTFVYGLGNDWEVGFNLLNVNYPLNDPGFKANLGFPDQARGPLLMMNAQKGFSLSKYFHIGVGTELGKALVGSGQDSIAAIGYGNLVYFNPESGIRFVIGGFSASLAFRGAGASSGIWLGGFVPIAWNRKLLFVGDSILAGNGIGITVLGGSVVLSQKAILSLGYQFPSPGSSSATNQGVVFEYTAFF